MTKLRVVEVVPIANDQQNERNDDEQDDVGDNETMPDVADDDDYDDDDDGEVMVRQPRRKHSAICQAGIQKKR